MVLLARSVRSPQCVRNRCQPRMLDSRPPIRPANRFGARDAADRRRLEAKRTSPVFVTDNMLRTSQAARS